MLNERVVVLMIVIPLAILLIWGGCSLTKSLETRFKELQKPHTTQRR
jgi:hypothetical protein